MATTIKKEIPMSVKNEDLLSMFQQGNKAMEEAVLSSGITFGTMRKAQKWRPPSKMPKDFVAISKVLQTFVTT